MNLDEDILNSSIVVGEINKYEDNVLIVTDHHGMRHEFYVNDAAYILLFENGDSLATNPSDLVPGRFAVIYVFSNQELGGYDIEIYKSEDQIPESILSHEH